MRTLLLTGLGLLVAGTAGYFFWRSSHEAPPAPSLSLDERPYDQTTTEEREGWMRKLGYVD